MSSRPTWTGTRGALSVLRWCWDLGLRPPAGAYTLSPAVSQKAASGDWYGPRGLMAVYSDDLTWQVESSNTVEELRSLRRRGLLQAIRKGGTRGGSTTPHRIGHHLPGLLGVPLITTEAIFMRRTCYHCGEQLRWEGWPTDEHAPADPRPVHPSPACQGWNQRHGDTT